MSIANQLFVEKLRQPGMEKLAADRLNGFVRETLYEGSVFAKLIPPQPVSPRDLDRLPAEENGGRAGLRKVIDKEFTDVSAVALDFRTSTSKQYIESSTFNINFHKIGTPIFEITEDELKAKEQPIQSILKNAMTAHIDRVIDETARNAMVEAVTGTSRDATTSDEYIMPRNIVKLINLIESSGAGSAKKKLKVETLLMTQGMWNQLYTWTQSDISSVIGEKYWADGFTYETLNKKRVIVTNKDDMFPTNEVWAFAAPEFLGVHYNLNDDRFEIQRDFDLLRFKAWKTHGAGFGNTSGIARLTFGA